MHSTLIMAKQASSIDAGIKKKAYAFLEKLIANDEAPGLHIEPIARCADPRVRTGRVDQQYRAVLFKLTGAEGPTYVLHGIFPDDEAYRVAASTALRFNIANSLPEIRTVEPPAEAAAATPPPPASNRPDAAAEPAVEPSVAAPAEPTPAAPAPDDAGRHEPASLLTHVSRADLLELGLPESLAEAALHARSEAELLALAGTGASWQQTALVGLGAGMTPDEVRAELELDAPDAELDATDDAQVLARLATPAAQFDFARIDGAEELRRVIESGDFGAWRIFLHPQQRRWTNRDYNGIWRLSGGAGTGKTVVVLHRARWLLQHNPDARLIATTFTVNLAAALARDLERLDPALSVHPADGPSSLGKPGATVLGIDAIAHRVLAQAAGQLSEATEAVLGTGSADVSVSPGDGAWSSAITQAGATLPAHARTPQFFADEYGLVILPEKITTRADYLRVRRPGRGVRLNRAERGAVWDVVEAYRQAARTSRRVDFSEAAMIAAVYLEQQSRDTGFFLADHVLVDEGQDMSPAHWHLLRALVAPGPNDLFIAEDSHQRIYGSKITLSRYGINVRGRSRRLTLNYRTTAENLHFAVRILGGGAYEDLEGGAEDTRGYHSARSGPQPQLIACASLTEELDRTADILRGWLTEPEAPRPDTFAILVRDSQTRDLVVTGLAERGVKVQAVERADDAHGKPVVMTMHRAKGTEFTRLILFGASERSIPRVLNSAQHAPEDVADAQLRERSLLYVAATRARDQLVICWDGSASPLLPR